MKDWTLFHEHAPLARRIAREIAKGLPASVEFDDLLQDGMLGLLDASSRCNRDMSPQQFRSFAARRVRGAVLDGLRASDVGGRRIRRVMRRIEVATGLLAHRLGREPKGSEIARELGVAIGSYQAVVFEADVSRPLSLDDPAISESVVAADGALPASDAADPLVRLERHAFQEMVNGAFGALPPRESSLMAMYYELGMTMREIGQKFGVSEARICQIHGRSIARLKSALAAVEVVPTMLLSVGWRV